MRNICRCVDELIKKMPLSELSSTEKPPSLGASIDDAQYRGHEWFHPESRRPIPAHCAVPIIIHRKSVYISPKEWYNIRTKPKGGDDKCAELCNTSGTSSARAT